MYQPIDLRSPAAREEWQLPLVYPETVPKSSQHRKTGSFHRDRGDTIALIVDALRSADRPLTRLEIARALGRAKTPWLIGVIESLARDGLIVKQIGDFRGLECWYYEAVKR